MNQELKDYKAYLINSELSARTIDKYIKDLENFYDFLGTEEITKSNVIAYKNLLLEKYKPSTTNNKIVILNKYLKFTGFDDTVLKLIKAQSKGLDNVLTLNDYNRLRRMADTKGTDRDAIMLDVLYYTGLRVSELSFLTTKSLKKGYISVDNKGKLRQVPITKKVKKILQNYCDNNHITSGPIILNNHGEPLSRNYIFKRIKYLAGQARIKKDKAYPHSIRHLFAKQWLANNNNNVLQLADILGHESLETTRIYTKLNLDELRNTINF